MHTPKETSTEMVGADEEVLTGNTETLGTLYRWQEQCVLFELRVRIQDTHANLKTGLSEEAI